MGISLEIIQEEHRDILYHLDEPEAAWTRILVLETRAFKGQSEDKLTNKRVWDTLKIPEEV